MQSASRTYKDSMKQPLRERGYLTVHMGVINLEAQKGAHVELEEVLYFSGRTQPFSGETPERLYATPEEDFAKVDGSMFFEPETGPYYNQGVVSAEVMGSVTVYLDMAYDIRGLTLLFGDCYPTAFTVETDAGTIPYLNDAPEWQTEDIFTDVSWIRIVPSAMVNGNGRMRILQFTCGTSVTVPVNKIQNYTLTDVVNPVSEALPTQDMKLELSNVDGAYNVDDSNSIINYLETGQEIRAVFSYDVAGDGVLEYMPPQTLYLKSADATDQKATISATDRFRLMDGTYYGGQYYGAGIRLYDLAVDVCEDAGLQEGEYLIDPYLKKVTVNNPLPVCRHPEALQIIANAGRCAVMFNRRGQIQLKSSFLPKATAVATGDEEWSNPAVIVSDGAKTWYATPDCAPVDGSCLFLPESGDYITDVGFVGSLSEEDGTFSMNQVITLTMESAFSCFGFGVTFHGSFPEEFQLRTYLQNIKVETIDCIPDSFVYATQREFAEFDTLELVITKGRPGRRIMVESIQFGDITDYSLTLDRDILSVPKTKKQDTVQAISVARTIYSPSTEMKELVSEDGAVPDADGNYVIYLSNASYGYTLDCDVATITNSSCWYVMLSCTAKSFSYVLRGYEYAVNESIYQVRHNPKGIVKSWKNELVSSVALAAELEEWLAEYYLTDMEYEVAYRGDPRIDANDQFNMEQDERKPIRIRTYSHTLKYDGTWDGSMKARKVV